MNDPVIEKVLAEVDRQVDMWGEQNHPDGTSEGARQAADVARLATQRAADDGTLTWSHIAIEELYEALAEEDVERLEGELVQTTAVLVSWLRHIARRRVQTTGT